MDMEALNTEISELKEELKRHDITASRREFCEKRILQLGDKELLLLLTCSTTTSR